MGKKKVNPRRIPLAKKDIDRDKIIEAAKLTKSKNSNILDVASFSGIE